mmetsp:Transcript_89692/g.159355  ORF Transcript_89692/g.159355 Transcript_89692/m.159355 type:complete len:518 (+) Transcript_89692:1354-2907(+)
MQMCILHVQFGPDEIFTLDVLLDDRNQAICCIQLFLPSQHDPIFEMIKGASRRSGVLQEPSLCPVADHRESVGEGGSLRDEGLLEVHEEWRKRHRWRRWWLVFAFLLVGLAFGLRLGFWVRCVLFRSWLHARWCEIFKLPDSLASFRHEVLQEGEFPMSSRWVRGWRICYRARHLLFRPIRHPFAEFRVCLLFWANDRLLWRSIFALLRRRSLFGLWIWLFFFLLFEAVDNGWCSMRLRKAKAHRRVVEIREKLTCSMVTPNFQLHCILNLSSKNLCLRFNPAACLHDLKLRVVFSSACLSLHAKLLMKLFSTLMELVLCCILLAHIRILFCEGVESLDEGIHQGLSAICALQEFCKSCFDSEKATPVICKMASMPTKELLHRGHEIALQISPLLHQKTEDAVFDLLYVLRKFVRLNELEGRLHAICDLSLAIWRRSWRRTVNSCVWVLLFCSLCCCSLSCSCLFRSLRFGFGLSLGSLCFFNFFCLFSSLSLEQQGNLFFQCRVGVIKHTACINLH